MSFKLNLTPGAQFSRKLTGYRPTVCTTVAPAWYVRAWRWLLQPVV